MDDSVPMTINNSDEIIDIRDATLAPTVLDGDMAFYVGDDTVTLKTIESEGKSLAVSKTEFEIDDEVKQRYDLFLKNGVGLLEKAIDDIKASISRKKPMFKPQKKKEFIKLKDLVFPDDSTTETDTLNMPGGARSLKNMSRRQRIERLEILNAEKKEIYLERLKDEGLDEQKKIETNEYLDATENEISKLQGAIDTDDAEFKRLQEESHTTTSKFKKNKSHTPFDLERTCVITWK